MRCDYKIFGIPSRLNGAMLVTAAGLFLFGTTAAIAATAQTEKIKQKTGSVIEEIIVTAQKRKQLIQDVPLAVTAFSGDQLKAMGMTQSVDISSMTPGVSVSASIGGQESQFTIRGVSQSDFTDSVESPIAVYVDGGYVAMQQGQTFALFDIDRVEVIKGPQSTLFGRNATGGVVQYISRKPTKDTEGFVDLTYGRFNQVRVSAAIGGSLSDKVMGRLSVLYNYHDPILKNQFPAGAVTLGAPVPGGGQDTYNGNTYAVRGQLLFELNDDAELLVSGFGARTRISTAPYQSVPTIAVFDGKGREINSLYASPTETREAIGPNGIALDMTHDGNPYRPVAGGDFFGYIDPDGSGRLMSQDFAFGNLDRFETTGTTAKLTWDFGNVNMVYITDYKHFYKFNALDVDAGPASQFVFASESRENTFTQEFRLAGDSGKIHWITGLYYLYINNKTNNGFLVLPSSVLSPVFLGARVGADLVNKIKLKTNSYSAFGQIEYDISDTVDFTAGVRIIREEKKYSFSQGLYASTGNLTIDTGKLVAPLRTPFAQNKGKTLWAGKIQLDWRPKDGVLLYASINRGVKAGSFNAKLPDGSPPLADNLIPYGAETLTNYEMGFKLTVLDGRARVNGSAYYYDYHNYQASVFTNVSNVIKNVNSTIKGAELEVLSHPVEGLDVMFGISVIDAKVHNLEIAPGIFRNVKPTFTPDLELSGLVRYEFARNIFSGHISLQADASYKSSVFQNIRNFDSQKLGSYIVTNLRVNWMSEDQNWTISAFVKNAFDRSYVTTGFDLASLCGCNETLYSKPRWWGVSVRREF